MSQVLVWFNRVGRFIGIRNRPRGPARSGRSPCEFLYRVKQTRRGSRRVPDYFRSRSPDTTPIARNTSRLPSAHTKHFVFATKWLKSRFTRLTLPPTRRRVFG